MITDLITAGASMLVGALIGNLILSLVAWKP